MKFLLFVVVGLLLFLLASIISIDILFYVIDRYSRFHIGRYASYNSWVNRVWKVTRKWSIKAPTVKITDNSRYVLLDMLKGRYRSQSIQSWQSAAIILGLMGKGDFETAERSAIRFLNNEGNWKKKPVAVDSSMLAYVILKNTNTPISVKPAMDYMIKLIDTNTDEQGLIAYTNISDLNRYVDTLGLVCPFLALYAKVYNCPQYAQLAFKQLQFFHDYALLADTNLPNHAVHSKTLLPLGVYGWGRGTAWYILGLMDTYRELPSGDNRTTLRCWIEEAAQCYLQFQHNDGGFGSVLQMDCSYDSSATAVFAWFYAECARWFGNEAYAVCAERCLNKLMSVTRITGKIDWCQGDTKGIGVFAQTYGIMPFAQGMTLRAIGVRGEASLYEKKIKN